MGPTGKIQEGLVDVGHGVGSFSFHSFISDFILVLMCPWISRVLLPTVSLEAKGGRKPRWKRGGCAKPPSILPTLRNKPRVVRLFCFTA